MSSALPISEEIAMYVPSVHTYACMIYNTTGIKHKK